MRLEDFIDAAALEALESPLGETGRQCQAITLSVHLARNQDRVNHRRTALEAKYPIEATF